MEVLMKMVKLLMSMALAMTLSVQMNNAADISTIKPMPAITISSGNLDDVKQSELAGKHHDNAMESAFDPYLKPETKWTWSEEDLAMTFGESKDAGHYIKTSGFLRYSEKKLCSFAERFKTAINAAKEQNAITAGYECLPKLLEAFEKCVKEATTKIDLTPAQKASLFIRIAALLDYVNDELFVNNFTKTYPFNDATNKEYYKENFAAKIKTVKDALWNHLDLPKIVDKDTISAWLEDTIKANSRTWGVNRYVPSRKTVCAILASAALLVVYAGLPDSAAPTASTALTHGETVLAQGFSALTLTGTAYLQALQNKDRLADQFKFNGVVYNPSSVGLNFNHQMFTPYPKATAQAAGKGLVVTNGVTSDHPLSTIKRNSKRHPDK